MSKPGWPIAVVGDLVSRIQDRVKIDPRTRYDTLGVRWYGKGAYLRPPALPKTKTLNQAHEGDFVFCRIDTQNGPFAIIPRELDGALVTNEFPLYKVDERKLLPEFLLLFFNSQSQLGIIDSRRDGRDGRARWKEADFESWEIPLPPLGDQGKIVEIMDSVTANFIAIQKEVAAAHNARSALLTQVLKNLPHQAVETTLKEVADWSSGKTPKADNSSYYGGGIPWAVIGDVRGRYISQTARTLTQSGAKEAGGKKKLVPPGTVLITMYGTIGNTSITETEMATNQAICRGVPNESVTAEYLRLWVSSKKSDLIGLGDGKTQSNINKEIIENFPVKVPPREDQERVVEIMSVVEGQIEALEEELIQMQRSREVLLESLLRLDASIPNINFDD